MYKRFHNKYSFSSKIRKPKMFTSNRSLSSKTKYDSEFYQFAIIDPGHMSCGVRIERCYLKTGKRKLIWFSVISFGHVTGEVNANMAKVFSPLKGLLEECHHIAIEYQLRNKSEVNYQCYSSMIYYISTEICTKGFLPNLFDIDVKLKTTYIGGPTTSMQNGGISIKNWTKEKAKEFCIEEQDAISYNILENSMAKALEDLSDLKCYCRGWIEYVRETECLTVPFNKNLLDIFI